MNSPARRVLELGIFFFVTVILIDALLVQIPSFDWFALGLLFLAIAGSILGLVAYRTHWPKRKVTEIHETESQLDRLTDIVSGALYRGDQSSCRMLSDELQSLAIGAIAVRTHSTKTEISAIAEVHPERLRLMVDDNEILNLLARSPSPDATLSQRNVEKAISKIESWSK